MVKVITASSLEEKSHNNHEVIRQLAIDVFGENRVSQRLYFPILISAERVGGGGIGNVNCRDNSVYSMKRDGYEDFLKLASDCERETGEEFTLVINYEQP